MTAADYILASIGLGACILWCLISLMFAASVMFVTAPNADARATSRKGCVALIIGIAAAAWLIGVLWAGSWGWIS